MWKSHRATSNHQFKCRFVSSPGAVAQSWGCSVGPEQGWLCNTAPLTAVLVLLGCVSEALKGQKSIISLLE